MRAALLLVPLLACATPGARPAGPAAAPPPPAFAGPWQSPLAQDHPLVGRAWHAEAGTFLDREALLHRLRGARFVLLGEKHDNPDHHRLQAAVLTELRGSHPRTVFEMLDADDDAALAALPEGADADAVAEAVDWAGSGWPDFAIYRPVFEAALRDGGRVLAGNPARADLKNLMMEGMAARPEAELAELGLDAPLPPAQEAALHEQIEQSHCGYADQALVAMMAEGQRYKDATLARRLREAAEDGGAALIAGGGHVRADRGVPFYLPEDATTATVLFVEVDDAERAPAAYEEPGFDLLVFTPRLDDEDPCDTFRKSLEKLGPAK